MIREIEELEQALKLNKTEEFVLDSFWLFRETNEVILLFDQRTLFCQNKKKKTI